MCDLQMYTCEEVGAFLGTNRQRIQKLRQLGLLHGIVTGNKIMFSYDEIKQFQRDYQGLDISNDVRALESLKVVQQVGNA